MMRTCDVSWLAVTALVAAACGTTVNVGETPAPPGDPGAPPGAPEAEPPPGRLPPGPGIETAPTFAEQALELGKRWEWLAPLPSGEPMYAVAGTSMSDLHYAGAAGTVLRWDGIAWTVHETDADVLLDQAWAPAKGKVWVAGLDGIGAGHLYRVSAGVASEDATLKGFAIQALTGLGESRAWAVGPRGEVKAYDGTSWSTIRAATGNWLRGIHGLSATNVWAVGDKGEIVHYDGNAWTTATWDGAGTNPFDPSFRYEGVWGASPNDVWAAAVRFRAPYGEPPNEGPPNVVFSHFDGTRWSAALAADACSSGYTNSGAWWIDAINTTPVDNARYYDVRRPFGPVLVGASARSILFQSSSMCPWRFDGTSWKTDPFGWVRGGPNGDLVTSSLPRRASLAALADGTLVSDDKRLDLTGSNVPAVGPNPHWLALRPASETRTNLLRDSGGTLWASTSAQISVWMPMGWAPFRLPTGVLSTNWQSYASGFRDFFTRGSADVWVSAKAWGSANTGGPRAAIQHWDGTAWQATPTPVEDLSPLPMQYQPEAIGGNLTHVWAAGVGLYQGGSRLLMQLGSAGLEASTEIHDALGFTNVRSGGTSLLADTQTGDRVFFSYPLSTGNNRQDCLVGSWNGTSAPRRELLIPNCDAQSVVRSEDLYTRLFRMADGSIAVLSPGMIATWDGTAVKTRVEATSTQGLLTLKAGTTTAKLANHAVYREERIQEIAHATGSLYWVLAGGGLFLWDASTDEIAFARHASSLISLASAENGEAWAVGPGLLHYVAPPPSPKSMTK